MVCYRHPDRETYVSCQRCDRNICGDCQVDSSVGFLCPDCAGGTPRKLTKQRLRSMRGGSPVTTALIAINVLVWILEVTPILGGINFLQYIVLVPRLAVIQPWTLITGGFAHDWSGPMHLLVNMYSLYIFGSAVEPLLGRARYLILYMTALFAGAVGVLWLGDPLGITVGASGAIFGLMGAYFIFLKALGQPSGQMFGLIAINMAFGFFASGISWQGHLGGLIGGLAVAYIYSKTRRAEQQANQGIAIAALIGVLVIAAFMRIAQLG